MKTDERNRAGAGLSLREAMHLHALEGNPFDADDVATFEMFDREGWSDERRRAYIVQQAQSRSAGAIPAAE